jgi:hypothetical protein
VQEGILLDITECFGQNWILQNATGEKTPATNANVICKCDICKHSF